MKTIRQIALDKHGIPVYPGDVLKTFHYKSRLHGRYMYLYHVAVEKNGHLEGRPAREINGKSDGGRFWLTTASLQATEIVQGYGPGPMDNFTDRKKKTK
jgi:hypothetical protein